MAAPKLASVTIFLALIVFSVAADVIVDGGEDAIEVAREDGYQSSVIKKELEKLNSKIRELEVLIDEKAQELEKKNELISQKDEIFRDKSARVSFLESEIESLQREGKLHVEETTAKAHSRAGELEKQVSELKRELDAQNREKNALEAQSNEAEKKMHEVISTLEKLQNSNEEQKKKIKKLERALKVAEEEMIKAKFEVTSTTEELMEVHGAWFPPWLASFWNKHAKPAVNMVMQKMWVGKTHVENWVGPHVEPIKSVKSTIQEVLNRHDITRAVATKEFEWLLYSALLILPILILFSLCCCCGPSREKARKPARPNQARHKAKKGTSGK
ncbi:coiled-coil domain-containing protein 150-like isoform X2 [Cucurbita moschata]|uniref:Coiled-coil domain-containing protein 150-like isoform X2 n=1 Tax=Cucurbita moschata TaxID=3662 RepID=A0A6J1GJY1_CUCMO|nr:coiled-coil domain-containing protein 150-like isoform X2 [Cucurbita moschata]